MASEIKRRFTDTEIQIARKTDLLELLTHLGYQVKRIGRYHTTAEMDSLRIKDRRTWFRYSQNTGGDAITLVQQFCDKTFPEAVEYLLTFNGRARDSPAKAVPSVKRDEVQKPFTLPPRNTDDRRVFAYLRKRGIAAQVIRQFMNRGLLYEDAEHHNCVFVGKNSAGQAKYAGLRGTYDRDGKGFRGDVTGSDKNTGFPIPSDPSLDLVHVFEAPIDLMSYLSLHREPINAKLDRAEFVRVVQEAQSSQQTAEVKKQRTRLAAARQRVSELEVLLCKIYEDNILGKLSDSRYATLDAQYEKEQAELTAEISMLEKAVNGYEKHEKDADRFIALIDKYESFDSLTIAMLNEFIEKILVHERDRKGSRETTQEVEIYFNFVGRFVPPAFGEAELTPEELEERRKKEERKDRLHQNYLKRKASGKHQAYENKIKDKRKADVDAKKAAIRAEDIAKGVFVPVCNLPAREPKKGVQTV